MAQGPHKVDVIVVGAGIAGASLAARLAGKASVLVLEMEAQPGYHTSGRSAATYEPTYGPPVIRELTTASGAFFHAPPEGFAASPLLAQRGCIAVGDPNDDVLAKEAIELGYRRASFAEAAARLPLLRQGAAHILFDDNVWDADVEALLRGFLGQHRRAGGMLLTAGRLEAGKRADGVWRLSTSAGDCEAPIVVDAAGAWADDVARRCGLTALGLTPKRRSVCIVPAPPGVGVANWPLLISLGNSFFAKPTGGKLMISPFDAVPSEPHDAFADDLLLAEGIDAYQQIVDHEVTRIERSWGGLRTFATDGDPVVGFDPAADGFFWCAGQGGYGIQTSPALSEVAAALVLGKPMPLGLSAQTADQISPARLRKA